MVLDTLRADHLSCYGCARTTSPTIDAFAKDATLYRDCVSTAPWTLPGHASLFAGKYPFEHGAYTVLTQDPRMPDGRPLPVAHLTLAEFLRAEGFETAAFVANALYCGPWTQLDQGFDRYFVRHMYAEAMLPRVFTWLEHRGAAPFFLFLNFMDTHQPYNVSPRPGFIAPPADPYTLGLARRFDRLVLPANQPVPERLRQKIIDQYDTAVANVDEQIGRLIAKLKALDLFENTVIVVTSDHGQYFGEHFLTGHSKDVYQPAMWVPLIVKAPGQKHGRFVETRVSLAMVPNLICTHLPGPVAARARESFPEAIGAEVIIGENYYTRRKDLIGKPWSARFNRVRRAVFEGRHKYIHSSDGRHELYDLAADPGETRNLLDSEPEVAARLAETLKQFLSRRPEAPQFGPTGPPLSDEELRLMATLGYIDTPEEVDEDAALPDQEQGEGD